MRIFLGTTIPAFFIALQIYLGVFNLMSYLFWGYILAFIAHLEMESKERMDVNKGWRVKASIFAVWPIMWPHYIGSTSFPKS